jgi:hypothetical protein
MNGLRGQRRKRKWYCLATNSRDPESYVSNRLDRNVVITVSANARGVFPKTSCLGREPVLKPLLQAAANEDNVIMLVSVSEYSKTKPSQ